MNALPYLSGFLCALSGFLTAIFGGVAFFAFRKAKQLNALMSSGIDTEGRILTIKQYMASGGPGSQGGLQEGNDIRYEFMNASNLPCEGKLLILTRRTSHIEELRENAPITITYLRDEPTVNIPKHFISDKMVPVLEYRRRISYLLLGCFVFCAVMGVLFCLEPPV